MSSLFKIVLPCHKYSAVKTCLNADTDAHIAQVNLHHSLRTSFPPILAGVKAAPSVAPTAAEQKYSAENAGNSLTVLSK